MKLKKNYNRRALIRKYAREYFKKLKPILREYAEKCANEEFDILYGTGGGKPIGIIKATGFIDKKVR